MTRYEPEKARYEPEKDVASCYLRLLLSCCLFVSTCHFTMLHAYVDYSSIHISNGKPTLSEHLADALRSCSHTRNTPASSPSKGAPCGVTPWCPCLRTARGTCTGYHGLLPGARWHSLRRRRLWCRRLRCQQACSWNTAGEMSEGSTLPDRTNLCCEHDKDGPPSQRNTQREAERERKREQRKRDRDTGRGIERERQIKHQSIVGAVQARMRSRRCYPSET